MKRCIPDLTFELAAWKSGRIHCAGVDEAGRGPWAGPLAAAAVILPNDPKIQVLLRGVRDSKQLNAAQRVALRPIICDAAVSWCVGYASVEEIDAQGLTAALNLAVGRAVQGLSPTPQYLFLDYMRLAHIGIAHTALKKGDARCLSIAAASILAKTARDQVMAELDEQYPGYGFAAHKGYGTVQHRRALAELGVSPVHRRSFSPIRSVLAQV